MTETARKILDEVLKGKEVTIEEANILMNPEQTELEELLSVANRLTRRVFRNEISMCAIYPAKVGKCSGDCAFCAQSAHHQCDVQPIYVNELRGNEIIENAKKLWSQGVRHYSLVTSGEQLSDIEFEAILQIFERLGKETKMSLCASVGNLTPKRAESLKRVGVLRYHHNIETSSSYFPMICSTHTYDDKMKTIEVVRQVGMELCCGGIIAMGESKEQRVEMAFALKEIDMECVPINILNAIPGTRLEYQTPIAVEEILRTIAVFRVILPNKVLKYAGGRENAMGEEEYKGYQAGINALLAGNYLTTSGKDLEQEKNTLLNKGYVIK